MTVSNHNWRVWHWPWHHVIHDDDYGKRLYSHFAGFGPFQWSWYSWSRFW